MKIREIITEDNSHHYYEYARQTAEKMGVPFSMVAHAMNKETGHLQNWADKAKAVSKAGAVGVMQLMPKTAKGLGVKDVRDPKQNIEAGVRYLGQLYNRFGGDPVKALAGYNTGPGNLNRLIRKYGDDYVKKLPRETRGYVADYNDQMDNIRKPDTMVATPSKHPYRDMATTALAAVTGSRDAYGADMPPRSTAFKPTQDVNFQTSTQPQSTATPQATTPTTQPTAPSDYTIKSGQTLSSIAKQHGTTVDQIMAMNPSIKDPNKISAGATIRTTPNMPTEY